MWPCFPWMGGIVPVTTGDPKCIHWHHRRQTVKSLRQASCHQSNHLQTLKWLFIHWSSLLWTCEGALEGRFPTAEVWQCHYLPVSLEAVPSPPCHCQGSSRLAGLLVDHRPSRTVTDFSLPIQYHSMGFPQRDVWHEALSMSPFSASNPSQVPRKSWWLSMAKALVVWLVTTSVSVPCMTFFPSFPFPPFLTPGAIKTWLRDEDLFQEARLHPKAWLGCSPTYPPLWSQHLAPWHSLLTYLSPQQPGKRLCLFSLFCPGVTSFLACGVCAINDYWINEQTTFLGFSFSTRKKGENYLSYKLCRIVLL